MLSNVNHFKGEFIRQFEQYRTEQQERLAQFIGMCSMGELGKRAASSAFSCDFAERVSRFNDPCTLTKPVWGMCLIGKYNTIPSS